MIRKMKNRTIVSGLLTTAMLLLTTVSTYSYADFFDGRVNVWNSPLNVRTCGSSSCQRVGRFLRDQSEGFLGSYSRHRWLEIGNFDGNQFAGRYVYGSYIRPGRHSLGVTYNNSYFANTTANLNLRNGPMVQYDRIAQIPKGEFIVVYGENGHYLDVGWRPDSHQFTPVMRGYVHSSYVRRR
jgi:uncharacterized protein YgiM (DUF1202 family)